MSRYTIQDALQKAQQQLAVLPEIEARLEAEILLAFSLHKQRSYLYAWPDRPIEPPQLSQFSDWVSRRIQGEPIAYITEHREFWSLDLKVTAETLIPRPETELLVELALEFIPPEQPLTIADLGTGSGAIAAAIATERPACHIFATDLSTAALNIAKENFKRLKLSRIHTNSGQWCNALPRGHQFDLIISNPPYISANDPHLKQGDLPWEPYHALASGRDGLDDIRCIIKASPAYLTPNGWLLLEHGYEQGGAVRKLLKSGGFKQISTQQDLAGRDRVTKGQF